MLNWLKSSRRARMAALLPALLSLTLLLGACGVEIGQPQVVVVTATSMPQQAVVVTDTPLPQQQVVVVTATPTPGQQVVVVTATPTQAPPTEQVTADVQGTIQAALAATLTAQPTDTPLPPTETPTPDLEATVQVMMQQTAAAAPTDTPVPPTSTPKPTAKPTAKPTSKPQASLSSYGVVFGDFAGGSETDENKYSVWVMRGDGSGASKVVEKGFEPAFSPDSNKFAYYHCWTGIRVYDLNKKIEVEVAPSSYAEFGSFSPDGKRLVYHEWVGNWWSANVNLYVINSDGTGRTQLPIQGMRPAWSPRGDLISYDSCTGSACGIYVVQPDGGGARQVTKDGGGKANWSPDGKKLVYGADVNGNPEIFVVNLDGSGKKQLTTNTGNDTLPVYSPDGQWIYWLSDQNGTAWAILAMRADGTDVRPIRGVGVPPRWQFSRLWVGWW